MSQNLRDDRCYGSRHYRGDSRRAYFYAARTLLSVVGILCALAAYAQPRVDPAWAHQHLGAYLWPRYPRLGGYSLAELIPFAEDLGLTVVRLHVTSRSAQPDGFVRVLQSYPYRKALSGFDTVIMTLNDASGKQFDPQHTTDLYAHLSRYLLKSYGNTNKTFVLGLWETDHWLPIGDKGRSFLAARQRGIEQGRAQVPGRKARVLSMVEVTKVEGDCVATRLLPEIKPDVVSLSWWSHAKNLGAALRRLKSLVPGAELMVGEMGIETRFPSPQVDKLLSAIAEAKAAGARWVVIWRLDGWNYGIVQGRDDGGWLTELWHALWPLLHGGAKFDPMTWNRRAQGLVLEAPADAGRLQARLPAGHELTGLAVKTRAGIRDLTVTWDVGQQVKLCSLLPPQASLMLDADGRSTLIVGPIRAASPEDWQPWQAEGLIWNKQFSVWQPKARGREGWLELTIASDYPIIGGTLWLCGRKAKQGDWGVRIKGYHGEWLECPHICDWRGEELVAAFPESFPSEWGPISKVTLRFWIRTDDESKDWIWTTSIMSLRVRLDIDTLSAPWPNPSSELTVSLDGDATVRLRATPRD